MRCSRYFLNQYLAESGDCDTANIIYFCIIKYCPCLVICLLFSKNELLAGEACSDHFHRGANEMRNEIVAADLSPTLRNVLDN